MPIEEETFYNSLGEEISRTYLVQQMIDYYGLKREIGETLITDFNEGSEIRNLLEAIAVDNYVLMEDKQQLTEIGFIETAYGEWLDKHGAKPEIQITRDTGQESWGTVTFTIPAEQTEEIVIPEGTIVSSTENDLQYETTGESIISVGETSVDAEIICLTTGSEGNCSANTITVFDDDYFDEIGLTVNNNERCRDGTDYEEDEDYRERLLSYVRADDFGGIGYYRNLCNNIDGVHDVILVDDDTYTKKVLVNSDVKPVTNSVLSGVLAELTNLDNIVLKHNFTVAAVNYKVFDFDFSINTLSEYDVDEIKEVIQKFIDGGFCSFDGRLEFTGVNIGQNVSKYELTGILQVLGNIESATVDIKYNNDSVDACTVESNQVVRIGTITVSQEVVE